MGVCRRGASEEPVPAVAYQLKQVFKLENPFTPERGWLVSVGWFICEWVTFVSWV